MSCAEKGYLQQTWRQLPTTIGQDNSDPSITHELLHHCVNLIAIFNAHRISCIIVVDSSAVEEKADRTVRLSHPLCIRALELAELRMLLDLEEDFIAVCVFDLDVELLWLLLWDGCLLMVRHRF